MRPRFRSLDQYVFDLVDGEVRAVRDFGKPYPAERIAVYFKNRIVQELGITSIRLEDIPAELRDPAEFLKQLNLSAWHLTDSIANPAPLGPYHFPAP